MRVIFVIPVCNEAPTLVTLFEGIVAGVGDRDFRVWFIDDGSSDDSWAIMKQLHAAHTEVGAIRFAQNMGKTQALATAFGEIEGDVVVTMDGDLQDDPEEIPRLLAQLDEGCDVVCGWKLRRQDPWNKTFPSHVYNGALTLLFGLSIHDVNTGFKAMRMEVAKSLPLFSNFHRLIPVLAKRNGYTVDEVPVNHYPRRFGQSKYGAKRYVEGIRDALHVWWLGLFGWDPEKLAARTLRTGDFVAEVLPPRADQSPPN